MILTDILSTAPSSIITLYEADFSSIDDSGEIVRFFDGTTINGEEVVWDGNIYTAKPIIISGLEWNGSGQLPTPKLIISNIYGSITALNSLYQDLIGLKIIRIRTLLKYLDAINFKNGINSTADPTVEYPREVYYIDRKASENFRTVEYELVSGLDISNIKVPKRMIIQNLCPWRYKHSDGNCGYIPSEHNNRYFNEYGVPVNTEDLDKCGKKLSDCKKRFGADSVLNFGGYPGAGLLK